MTDGKDHVLSQADALTKKCNRDIVDEVVIEVDELDKGNISGEA